MVKKTTNKGNLKSDLHNDSVPQLVFFNLLKSKFLLKTKKDLTTKTPRKKVLHHIKVFQVLCT